MSNQSELHEAFVEVYPRYVATVLHQGGIEVDELIADAIVEGTAVLDGLLMRLEAVPPAEQIYSPLELFAESLRPINRALDTAGVEPKGAAMGLALYPWDVHGLVPGSSKVLGERAHAAHLAWGVSKAHALGAFSSVERPVRPGVLVLCRPEDVRPLEVSLAEAGYRWVDNPTGGAVVALVDDDVSDADAAVAEAIATDHRVVVYGEIDDIRGLGLAAAGVWKTASRSQVLNDLEAVLPSIA
jgi:hypothetical protein